MRLLIAVVAICCVMGCCKRQIVPPIDDRPPVAHVDAPKPLVMAPPVQTTTPEPEAIVEPLAAVVRFGFDSDAISADGMKTIEYVVARAAGRRLRLVGAACPIGPEAYNLGLGLRRAQAVEAMLMRLIPGVSCCLSESIGEAGLVTNNPLEYWRNRRCEISAE